MFKNKKLLIYLLIPVLALILSACSIEEDYYIFSDGSAVYQHKNDLNSVFAMMSADEEMSEEDMVEAEIAMMEDYCDEQPDKALYYNCFMEDKIAYIQGILIPDLDLININEGIYEVNLYDYSNIFEASEGDFNEEGLMENFEFEAHFNFEGEIIETNIGEINGNTLIISLDDLRGFNEDPIVRARVGSSIDHFEELVYKTQIKEDGLANILWPYVPKEYTSIAKEIWSLSDDEFHEQIINSNLFGDGVLIGDEVSFEKIKGDYYIIWPVEDKINFVENNEGNLEIGIVKALLPDNNNRLDFEVDDFYPLKGKFEIEFFSDIISAEVGEVQANVLKLTEADLSQLSTSSKAIIFKSDTTNNNKTLVAEIKNQKMHNNLKGKILLKVEANGEAYYVHPEKLEMFSLGRPDDAFAVMREQGIGISNENLLRILVADASAFADFDSDEDGYDDYTELKNGYNPYGEGKINYDQNFASKNAGRIFLQVENNGEAWYINPEDNKRYFLGRPADAFLVMRNLGLGISNDNLSKLID